MFVCLDDGAFQVVDLNSAGGTYVNGARVNRLAVRSGDELRFATVTAVFRYVAGPCLDNELQNQCTMIFPKGNVEKKAPSPNTRQIKAALIMNDGVRKVLPLSKRTSVRTLEGE